MNDNKKCKDGEHEMETRDPCPRCGYDEGECKYCGVNVDESGDEL